MACRYNSDFLLKTNMGRYMYWFICAANAKCCWNTKAIQFISHSRKQSKNGFMIALLSNDKWIINFIECDFDFFSVYNILSNIEVMVVFLLPNRHFVYFVIESITESQYSRKKNHLSLCYSYREIVATERSWFLLCMCIDWTIMMNSYFRPTKQYI